MFVSDLLKYAQLGNGVILKYKTRFLFTVGKKDYWKRDKGSYTITFTNTGGHVEEGESILTATRREVKEELGCEVDFQSATQTLYCNLESPKFQIYTLKDKITPILIYNSQEMKMSVCVYLGHIFSLPEPKSEVPAILLLPPKLIHGGPLDQLLANGASIYEQIEKVIPKSAIMTPFGSAYLLAAHWEVFIQQSTFKRYINY